MTRFTSLTFNRWHVLWQAIQQADKPYGLAIPRLKAAITIILAVIWWLRNAFFGSNRCEQAKIRLQKTQADEQAQLKQSKEKGYPTDTESLKPLIRKTQSYMYAQQDVTEACR